MQSKVESKQPKELYWLSPVLGVLGPLAIFSLFAIWGSFDFGEFGYFLLMGAAFIWLVLWAMLKPRRRVALLLTACAVLLTSVCIFKAGYDLRAWVRWTLGSWGEKAELQRQSKADETEFRHLLWDGWGFAGAGDTDVFLVLDPGDSLASAARTKRPGKFVGLPCEVSRVRRLEPHWYAVTFYTNTSWESCE